jgi:hypothetical protein
VVGLGAGQGKAQVRAQVAQPDGHLRRVFTYTDQAVGTQARLSSKIMAAGVSIAPRRTARRSNRSSEIPATSPTSRSAATG